MNSPRHTFPAALRSLPRPAPAGDTDAASRLQSRRPALVLTPENTARFAQCYSINPETGCWEWQCNLTDKGYGRFFVARIEHAAHRVSYQMHKGVPPGVHFVCHSCDNRRCVNPGHLWLGTPADNTRDASAKGRLTTLFRPGARNPSTTLTDDQARAIRTRYRDGEPPRLLAAEYGVNRSTIWRVATAKTWGHAE